MHCRNRCRAAFVTPGNILLTEALEYTRQKDQKIAFQATIKSKGDNAKGQGDKYIRSQLVPFRVAMGCLHAEMGCREGAIGYLGHVLKVIPPAANTPLTSARTVSDVADGLMGIFSANCKEVFPGPSNETSSTRGFRLGGLWPFGSLSATRKESSPTPKPVTAPSNPSQPNIPNQSKPESQTNSTLAPNKQALTMTHHPIKQDSTPYVPKDTPSEPTKEITTDKRSESRWTSWLRGKKKAQPKKEPGKEEDEFKPMHLENVGRVPVFNKELGTYEFPETEEEKAQKAMAAAGPPPMSAPKEGLTQPTMSSAACVTLMKGPLPPTAQSPLPPPPPSHGPVPMSSMYVDMFNN
eukprot:Tbor_TRINITY_DN5455_c2_g1::TRINITY_DN5455_c2_g1_i1::g.24797::m.24797